jgi:hypothetical protein
MKFGMDKAFSLRHVLCFAVLLVSSNCGGTRQGGGWDDIDYSKVRNRDVYENDSNYTAPSVLSCTSDDLYTCN